MRHPRALLGVVLGVCCLAACAAAWGQCTVLMQIKGSKQGLLAGESTTWKAWIACRGFRYEVAVPTAGGGMAAGQTQHSLIMLTKEIGAASPQIFQALTTNEVLPTVELQFIDPSKAAGQTPFYKITLKNALLREVSQYLGPREAGQPGLAALEDVSFSCQTVEVSYPAGNVMAMEEWHAAPGPQGGGLLRRVPAVQVTPPAP